MSFVAAMVVALVIDAVVGWPAALYQRIGHPVTWFGKLIDVLDRRWNIENDPAHQRRLKGIGACVMVVGLVALGTFFIMQLLPSSAIGTLMLGLLAWPLVAARSLHEHVGAVAAPLAARDIAGARHAVSMIVGRNTDALDEAGVSRAAIESLAENASDGVVAPIFWGALLGLPGIAAYKSLNTLDSMIGHRTPRYEAFGWASARLDDVANFIPARLTGFLFALVAADPRSAFSVMLRDAGRHRSPNAGWPEAAMAGALGIRLSGPRQYHDRVSDEPWLNAQGDAATGDDIRVGLRLFVSAIWVLTVVLAGIAVTMHYWFV